MKSPKARFLDDKPAVNFHADLVVSDVFLKAINASMLQMTFINGIGRVDAATASAAHYKMQGAQEFLGILLTLADLPTKLPEKKEPDNLNWNA